MHRVAKVVNYSLLPPFHSLLWRLLFAAVTFMILAATRLPQKVTKSDARCDQIERIEGRLCFDRSKWN